MSGASGAALSLPPWRAERILFDDAGILVVDKPAHVPVHGGDETLAHSVVDRIAAFLAARGRSTYLGVHSRLDQETTGVLLFTTDEAKNAEVKAAFEGKRLERVYHAIVGLGPGAKLRESGSVELRLDEERGRSLVVSSGGKLAKTSYRVLERRGDRALVELSLETGRMHQIRVSLAHLGAPVVGDTLYGGEPHARLHLHASRLSGGPLPGAIESALPAHFSETLRGEVGRAASIRDALLDAASLRAPLLAHTNAFRLVNGEGDSLPGLTIDAYGTAAVVNVYDPRYRENFSEIEFALRELGFECGYDKTRVKADLRKREASELAPEGPWFGSEVEEDFFVVENGMKIAIDLADGLSTGLFVDQRDHRRKARDFAGGGKVLNLFCYTGSFSVSTALSGAKTVSVDLSGRAIERVKHNFALNGLSLEGHSMIKDDAMKFLARAVKREARYDLVILDPPSFATVGKGIFSVSSRYEEAAAQCLTLLRPGGRLLAVTNHEKTSMQGFRKMLENAALRAKVAARVQTLGAQLDCPNSARGPFPSKSLLVSVQ